MLAEGMDFRKVTKAVIPVAGLGTRFLPITKAIAKEMLPIVDRPTIQYIVDEAFASGIEQVVLVTGPQKYSIEDFFDHNARLEERLLHNGEREKLELLAETRRYPTICSIRQREPLGLGHAVLCAYPVVGDSPFVVLLGDDVIRGVDSNCKAATRQLLDAFDDTGKAQVALVEVSDEDVSRYGIVEGHLSASDPRRVEVERIIEKPGANQTTSRLGVVGRYVLPPSIWPILRNIPKGAGGEYQLTDALMQLHLSEGIMGYRFDGMRVDTGEPIGLLRANLLEAMSRAELKPHLVAMMEELLAANDTVVNWPLDMLATCRKADVSSHRGLANGASDASLT
jgi:UTP--glucose-1-phosphate uridylyltransferase